MEEGRCRGYIQAVNVVNTTHVGAREHFWVLEICPESSFWMWVAVQCMLLSYAVMLAATIAPEVLTNYLPHQLEEEEVERYGH